MLQVLLVLLLAPRTTEPRQTPTPEPSQGTQALGKEALDQLTAPIALYPDALLSQVLMASTYPSDVAEAIRWTKANPKDKGDAAVKKVESKPWDPSVQSLVAFPEVLLVMEQDPDWVRRLGDAFLAQPDDVMDSVQRLRQLAKKEGTLDSNDKQTVETSQEPEPSGGSTTIITIEPSNPEVVYVPSYNPTTVYGVWPYPAYPPTYYPPGYGLAAGVTAGLAWGIGVGVTSALWGGFNWGRGDVDINVNRYNRSTSVNNRIQGNRGTARWQHNSANRRGVPYGQAGARDRYGGGLGGAEGRQQFRGRDVQRSQAERTLQQRAPGSVGGTARERAQGAQRAAPQGGFERGSGGTRSFDRGGAAARSSPSSAYNRGSSGGRMSSLSGSSSGRQASQQFSRGSSSMSRGGFSGSRGGGFSGMRGGGGRRR